MTPYFFSQPGADPLVWQYTDISIERNPVSRLPVIDFYISDIRDGEQIVVFELRELCFD